MTSHPKTCNICVQIGLDSQIIREMLRCNTKRLLLRQRSFCYL
nr:MAG TPA: hypothetical protein [Caudoviricetes sp.]